MDALILHLLGSPDRAPDSTPHVACRPTEITLGTGYHKHRCHCGTCWKHDDLLPAITTREEFDHAHTCPSCGSRVTLKHFTGAEEVLL